MQTILIDNIVIPEERQRKFFDEEKLNLLVQDLLEPHGLLHPIILQDDGCTLVAGERRLRAISILRSRGRAITHQGNTLPLGEVPFLRLGQLSPDELIRAELSENIERQDLTWQEVVDARAKYSALRRRVEPGVPDKTIARELAGKADDPLFEPKVNDYVRDAELLNENMHRESVRKAKSQKEAMRNLTRELEADLYGERAKRFEKPPAGKHSPKQELFVLIKGDATEELPKLQRRFACVIADPPYGVNADAFGDQSSTKHLYNDSRDYAVGLYRSLFDLCFRCTEERAHAYFFCDIEEFFNLRDLALQAGWSPWSRPLLWHKGTTAISPQPDYGPRNSYECILYLIKGKRMVTGLFDSIIKASNDRVKNHGAQKPVELYEDLIRRSCRQGDHILDPTCGSGTIFPAARRTSCYATGIELNETYYNIALNRLNSE